MNVKMGGNLALNNDVMPYIDAVGLKGKEKKLPSQLSDGEQQRVSIDLIIYKQNDFFILENYFAFFFGYNLTFLSYL